MYTSLCSVILLMSFNKVNVSFKHQLSLKKNAILNNKERIWVEIYQTFCDLNSATLFVINDLIQQFDFCFRGICTVLDDKVA